MQANRQACLDERHFWDCINWGKKQELALQIKMEDLL